MDPPCEHCTLDFGPFCTCVFFDIHGCTQLTGSCANCAFHGSGSCNEDPVLVLILHMVSSSIPEDNFYLVLSIFKVQAAGLSHDAQQFRF